MLSCFEQKRKLLSGIVIVNDGGVTKTACTEVANANGWWLSYSEKDKKRVKDMRWHYIKVSVTGPIRQEDYVKKGVRSPARVFKVVKSAE